MNVTDIDSSLDLKSVNFISNLEIGILEVIIRLLFVSLEILIACKRSSSENFKFILCISSIIVNSFFSNSLNRLLLGKVIILDNSIPSVNKEN